VQGVNGENSCSDKSQGFYTRRISEEKDEEHCYKDCIHTLEDDVCEMKDERHSPTQEPVELERHGCERDVELWVERGERKFDVFDIYSMHDGIIDDQESIIDGGEVLKESLAKRDPWEDKEGSKSQPKPMPTAPINNLHAPSMP
jgi:hypothetical protein